jgi:uncharacterized protein (DUF169 family)
MSNEPMKIPVNYAGASETLIKVLHLKGSPVAIKFATSKDEIPAGMVELDKTIRHCSMVNLARNEGKIFYATAVKHECNGGAWALGLREITPTLKTGDFYFRLGKFDTAAPTNVQSILFLILVRGTRMQQCTLRSKRRRSHRMG